MSFSELGIRIYRLLVAGDDGAELALIGKQIPQIVIALGEIRIDRNRALKTRFCFLKPSQVFERLSHPVVNLRHLRMGTNRGLLNRQRLLEPALLSQGQS